MRATVNLMSKAFFYAGSFMSQIVGGAWNGEEEDLIVLLV
jgi:hypothetical protein